MTRRAVSSILSRASDYVCPSCRWQQTAARHVRSRHHFQQAELRTKARPHASLQNSTRQSQHSVSRRQSRSVSLASSTAINAPSQTPQRYQKLYNALLKLQNDAGAYADLSRIQLALKSYESEHPAVRIGFLTVGENGAVAARNLARVLLSDALGEEQAWEKELLNASDGRSLLLRYGEVDDLSPSNAFMRTLSIPSPFLLQHRLEILVAPLQTNFMQSQSAEDIEDALLVPSLTIPASGGRVGFVRNPVHKSLIIAVGIEGAVQIGRLNLPQEHPLISAIVNVAQNATAGTVDVKQASQALDIFRHDQASGASFGTDWLASRVPDVASWMTADNLATVKTYTERTLAAVQRAIDKNDAEDASRASLSAVPETQRSELQRAVKTWSAEAHNDLRNNLLTALDSRAWRRTNWIRLLWRIDDVSYSSTDILNQCWLNETEQRLAFLSGRIRQAGLASEQELKTAPESFSNEDQALLKEAPASIHASAQLRQYPALLSNVRQQTGIDLLFDPPWPQTINFARQAMLHTDVPAMHRKAQGLVLSTLTTTGATSALGIWLWIASSGVALYEPGAIVALGLVWSLRRLQRLWGKERDGFSAAVQENGRRVLVEIETQLFKLVQDGGRTVKHATDAKDLAQARAAVSECQEALSEAH